LECLAERSRFRQRRLLELRQRWQREPAQQQQSGERSSGALCPRIYAAWKGDLLADGSGLEVRFLLCGRTGLRFFDCGKQHPASGYRHNSSGALTNVGSEGDYWSASPYAVGSGNAGFLNFNSNGNVNPLNNTNRANGLPVRCARAFTLLGKKIFSTWFGWLTARMLRLVVSRNFDCGKQRPASGYRERSSGALGGVGDGGWYWSASPNAVGSVNAGNLNFNSDGNVNPLNNNNRANGFPVRCARAFTLLEKKKTF